MRFMAGLIRCRAKIGVATLIFLTPGSSFADKTGSAGFQLSEIPVGYNLQSYDDCGVPDRQPHVPSKACHTFADYYFPDRAVDVSEKAKSNTYGTPNFDMVFEDMCADVSYVLAVTYASEKSNRRVQSLVAGSTELHGPHLLPDGASERLFFRVPTEAIVDGRLALHFIRNEGPNATASVIELWTTLPSPKAFYLELAPSLAGKLFGCTLDLAYDGIAGARVTARDAASGDVLGEVLSRTNGSFSIDLSGHVKPGSTGSIDVVARTKYQEAKGTVDMSDLSFVPPRFRPIADVVAGIKSPTILLDGVWRINPSPQGSFQTDPTTGPGWSNFTVPGQWLQQGLDIPRDQPAAVASDFQIPKSWAGKRIILRFDAIHGGTDYWLNGKHLGYSENLFTPVEFDVTDAARAGGTNHLAMAIKVQTASETASISSDYAHHNLGGIDRSVRLFALPSVHLSSLHHETLLDSAYRDAVLVINAKVTNSTASPASDMTMRVSLYGPDGKRIPLREDVFDLGDVKAGEAQVSKRIPVANPLKWSSEKPHLYRLTVELVKSGLVMEELNRQVGFRKVEIHGTELWVNGKPVKLAGMCRHEIDPLTGRAGTAKHAEADAQFFKYANINFIRTSHYPPTREFLEACDKIGLYVECEAPFCWTRNGRGEDDHTVTRHFLEPTAAMIDYCRDHPSVIIWSLANESGSRPDGENRLPLNFAETLKLCRETDPSRLVIFNNEWSKDGGACDLACVHYPAFPVEQHPNIKEDTRPILADEYFPVDTFKSADELRLNPGLDIVYWPAGQNSPNSYWSQIYASSRVIGGSIWAGIDEEFYFSDGSTMGDGPWGFIDVWRRPKSVLWDAKLIHSPIWIPVRQIDYAPGQKVVRVPVENRYSFTDLGEIGATWELGSLKGRCKVALPPGQKGEIDVLIPTGTPSGSLLILRFTDSKGKLVTAHGVRLGARKAVELPKPNAGCPDWQDDGKSITVRGNGFSFVIDRTSGKIVSGDSGRVPLLEFPRIHCARKQSKHPWNPSGLTYAEYPDASSRKIESVKVENRGEALAVSFHDTYTDFKGSVEMLLDKSGVASVSFDYVYSGEAFDACETGLRFLCDKRCQEISWKRETQWHVYPEDHIGRPEGHASAVASEAQGKGIFPPYKSNPTWPWQLDATVSVPGTSAFRNTT